MKQKFDYRECLTNEMLNKGFDNQFDMVAEAIKRASYLVYSGKEEAHGSSNLAFYVLSQMAQESEKKEL